MGGCMALFAISDLHLSFGTNKPMDIFGWHDYERILEENWNGMINEGDTVLMPGDISWAMYLEETNADFTYIEKLKGIKIISKGNHDYWWTTKTKLDKYTQANGFPSFNFLHNNCYYYNDYAICGCRGWGPTDDKEEDERIYRRELERLVLSLRSAQRQENIICMLHYPPFALNGAPGREYIEIFKNFGVQTVIYGHLHGKSVREFPPVYEGIEFFCVSCDYLDMKPKKLLD